MSGEVFLGKPPFQNCPFELLGLLIAVHHGPGPLPRVARQARGDGCPGRAGDRGKAQGNQDFTVPYRRWVVERTFAWMSRCRRLAKDSGRSLADSVAWARLGACRFLVRRLARDAGA